MCVCVRVSAYVRACMGECASLHVCMRARVYVSVWMCA